MCYPNELIPISPAFRSVELTLLGKVSYEFLHLGSKNLIITINSQYNYYKMQNTDSIKNNNHELN